MWVAKGRCFGPARGAYFERAARDDRLAPGYLSSTVAALRAQMSPISVARHEGWPVSDSKDVRSLACG
jgi:hypothetical protein